MLPIIILKSLEDRLILEVGWVMREMGMRGVLGRSARRVSRRAPGRFPRLVRRFIFPRAGLSMPELPKPVFQLETPLVMEVIVAEGLCIS